MTATTTQLGFAELLIGVLGHRDGEHTSLLYIQPDGETHTAVMDPADAVAAAAQLPADANCYFGVNPVKGPARKNAGRGKEADVTRLAALFCELDVKPGAFPSLDIAKAVIAELSIILGTRPSALVYSGGGVHAHWPVSDGDDTAAAKPILRRWGRLVALVADKFGANVDNVYDLPRMLRIPGSNNNKIPGQPRAVTAEEAPGGPLELAEIAERLDEMGIFEIPEDTADSDTEIAPPGEWKWAERTCPYVAKMIGGYRTDSPKRGRNPWLLSQRVRLACAHRLGCITEADYQAADTALRDRFAELVADPQHGDVRAVKRMEHADTQRCAIRKAAAKTDEQARAELGGHTHTTGGHTHTTGGDNGGTDSADDVKHSGQLGMAKKLAARNAHQFRYVAGVGWHEWDGRRWAPDERGGIERAVHNLIAHERREAAKITDEEAKDKRFKEITRYESATAIAGIVKIAQTLHPLAVHVSDVDADPYLINLANGTLDLRTYELRDHNPGDLITKIAVGAYRPEDTHHGPWADFVESALPDEAVRNYLQRVCGVALLGRVTEHVLPILTGEGGNGKGTCYQALLATLGDYGLMGDPDLFQARRGETSQAEMALRGRRLVIVSESGRNVTLDEARMKRLTGGDVISGRYLYQLPITFKPSHTPILVTNDLPTVPGDDPAVWRRVRVVPFDQSFVGREDKGLDERLEADADAILSWAVEGWRDYRDRGDELDEPDEVLVRTKAYREDSDPVARFLADPAWCLTGSPANKATTGQLHTAYTAWAKAEGGDDMNAKSFGHALDRKGYKTVASNGRRWRIGLAPGPAARDHTEPGPAGTAGWPR